MEGTRNEMKMLDLMMRPAFCVADGVVIYTNHAAQQQMLHTGTHISDLLVTGSDEYSTFSGGCLYLELSAGGAVCSASVTRMDGFDVFVLEQNAEDPRLQALALAAKELRQPLSSVMMVSGQLLPTLSTEEDPILRQQVARINRGLFQLLRVVSNMSDASLYTSSAANHQEITNVSALMEEIFQTASGHLENAGIHLTFTNDCNGVFSHADAVKLERAVNNLISNAAKFTPKGGCIQAKLFHREKKLYLTVQDSGIGVAPDLRGNIYSRYQRQPGVEDSRFGIGLGMVLVRAVAAQHGGTVLVDYPEEGGTRVTMTLQIRQEKSAGLNSPIRMPDYLAGWDHALVEMSDLLPYNLYETD